MWLIPFDEGQDHTITIDLGRRTKIGAIRVFNYNKSEVDSLRGARTAVIKVDNELVTSRRGIQLSKAQGFASSNFGQTILLPVKSGFTTE